MNLVSGSMKRPVTVVMLTAAALLFGLVSLGRLPLNLLPDISYPTLTIQTEYPDAAPAEVEKLITEPLEESVAVVRGLRGLRSTSRPGVSEIVLEFGWKSDMDYAALDVREKIDMIHLPDDADSPTLLRFDPSLDPIMRIGLAGDKDPVTLRHLAERMVKKDLESISGVASVRVHGGLEEEIQVEVDEGKLAALDIPIETVSRFLQQQNINAAGGRLRDREAEFLVRTMNEFDSLEDLRQTVLFDDDGRQVLVEDVATVERGFKEREIISRVKGKEAIELSLFKEGDANTVHVARSVATRLDHLEEALPEGVSLRILSDQATFIEQSINEVRSNALIGGILAVFVLFLFLRQRKATAIIGLVIPISILATFFVMGQFGVSLNIMSLGGLALGVGMLVDNAIVVLESIHRHQAKGASIWEATREGASEVSRAVVASTLTTVAVFLPIIFVEGIAGQIFRDQALTVTASLVVSLIAALTLIPMLSVWGMKRKERDVIAGVETRVAEGTAGDLPGQPIRVQSDEDIQRLLERAQGTPKSSKPAGRFKRGSARVGKVLAFLPMWILRTVFVLLPGSLIFLGRHAIRFASWLAAKIMRPINALFDLGWNAVANVYPYILSGALRHRGPTLAGAVGLAAIAAFLLPGLGTDLVPQFSQGQFTFDLELPPGTPLRKTENAVAKVEELLVDDDRIGVFFTSIGESPNASSAAVNRRENLAQLNVVISDPADTELEARVIDSVRHFLEEETEFRHTFRRPSYFSFKTPIEVHVFGYDIDELQAYSSELASDIARIEGLKDVRTNLEEGSPEVQIEFRRDRMASFDLDLESVAHTLRNKIRGDVATRLKERDRQLDILVRTAEASQIDVSQVQNMVVSQVEGVPIPLSSVANVNLGRGPSEITRIDQHRAAIVSANLDGRDLGSASASIKEALLLNPPPRSLAVTLGGQNDEVSTSFRSLMLAVALAAFMVYMVMASQFESFLHPFVIMLTVPLGMIGVVFALKATGTSVSVVVLIGAVMLTGIVVNNAIVLIDFINQRRRAGLAKLEAILEGGQARLRPIMMTTTTTVLGLTPMALGLGEGAEIRTPMAVAVIGGLLFATALTLVVIPVVYATMDRRP